MTGHDLIKSANIPSLVGQWFAEADETGDDTSRMVLRRCAWQLRAAILLIRLSGKDGSVERMGRGIGD